MGINGAWSSEVVTANQVIISGPNGGMWIYNGAPAFGNLIETDGISQAGTDQYGNAYLAGATVYQNNAGLYYATQINPNTLTGRPGVYYWTATSASGPYAVTGFVISDGSNLLVSASGLIIADSAIAAQSPSTPGTAESWHPISLASGWSTSAGNPVPSYQLLNDGNIQIVGFATHASFSSSIALSSAALPAAYRPSTTQYISAFGSGNAALEVSTAGNLTAVTGTAVTSCVFNGSYPVNL